MLWSSSQAKVRDYKAHAKWSPTAVPSSHHAALSAISPAVLRRTGWSNLPRYRRVLVLPTRATTRLFASTPSMERGGCRSDQRGLDPRRFSRATRPRSAERLTLDDRSGLVLRVAVEL